MKLIRRRHPSGWHTVMSVFLAMIATTFLSLIVLWLTAEQPLEALWQMLTYPYQGGTVSVQWGKAVNTMTYLAVIGLGLSIGFRANVWNIGAEGQFAFGGIGAFGTWLFIGTPDSQWATPILLAGGAVCGMGWACIPAFLRTKTNTNELLTSLMLVYVAGQTLFFLSNGPWETNFSYSPPQTDHLPTNVLFKGFFPITTKLHWGLIISAFVYALISFILLKTILGFRLAVAENTPKAESFSGFSPNKTVWIAFLFSGGLAGLMGAIYLCGDIGYLTEASNFLRGFGFSAIVVAFLGRLHPLGILFAALFLGYVEGGATWIQANLQEDDSIAGFIEVIALMSTLASAVFVNYRIEWNTYKSGLKTK